MKGFKVVVQEAQVFLHIGDYKVEVVNTYRTLEGAEAVRDLLERELPRIGAERWV